MTMRVLSLLCANACQASAMLSTIVSIGFMQKTALILAAHLLRVCKSEVGLFVSLVAAVSHTLQTSIRIFTSTLSKCGNVEVLSK